MLGFVLLRIPAVQERLAGTIGDVLSEKIGSKVHIGQVDIRLFNRVIVDDVLIYDQQQKQMLKAGRISAAIDLIPLFNGKISISSAQLFGTRVLLYKKDADSPLNCQFMLDSLASKSEEKTPLDVHISSLIIRNGSLKYDRFDKPEQKNSFTTDHLNISKISGHLTLEKLTDNEIHADIKKLSFREACGLVCKDLHSEVKYSTRNGKSELGIHNFGLTMPETQIDAEDLNLAFTTKNGNIDYSTIAAKGKIEASSLSAKDFGAFIGNDFAQNIPVVNLKADVEINNGDLQSNVNINSIKSDDLNVNASISGSQIFSRNNIKARIKSFGISDKLISNIADHYALPEELTRLGDVNINGDISTSNNNTYDIDANINTSKAGSIKIKGDYKEQGVQQVFNADINTLAEGINLAKILDNNSLGNLKCDLELQGSVTDKNKIENVRAKGFVEEVTYANKQYTNIDIDANYNNDKITGTVGINDPDIHFTANIESVMKGGSMDNVEGSLEIQDIYLAKQDAALNSINLVSTRDIEGKRMMKLSTDFAEMTLTGDIKLSTLPQSLANLVTTHLPSIPGLPSYHPTNNNYNIEAYIDNIDFIKKIADIPLDIHRPVTISGFIKDDDQIANISIDIPGLNVNETRINGTRLQIWTEDNSLKASLSSIMQTKKSPVSLNIDCNARNNNLVSSIAWNNNRKEIFRGKLNTITNFYRTLDGTNAFDVTIPFSNFEVGDTIWNISSENITYNNQKLKVNHLNVGNDTQHVYVNGIASKAEQDSIVAELKNIDVNYILDLVNFTSVRFDGYASGEVTAYSVFDKLIANAKLNVKDFLFETGRMGTLYANAKYSNQSQQIDIDAIADDSLANAKTIINGYVSPQRNSIDLAIKAENTRLEFMQGFCGSFLHDIDLHGDGEVRLHGLLSGIELTGEVVAHGATTLTSTNCRYSLPSDTVRFVPGDILFDNAPITDKYGNTAYLTGGIHHVHLGRMSYDLHAKTQKFLAYDFPTLGNSTFCGKAMIDGTVDVKGKGNELNINANAKTLKDTYLIYNTTSPDAITTQEFITWGSMNDTIMHDTLTAPKEDIDEDDVINSGNARTNIRMNFMVDVTPESKLHLLMDAITGDYIDLFGNGDLRISFYNKGSLSIFGNYNIEYGTYKMTIQNILRRDFAFQKGSLIAFGGDPFEAILRMKAAYQLNSVSLSDLNIGSSFKANNVPVNCIMDITGTAGKPVVDFSLDLPSLSTDARQMVYSVINSEESMNQQVLYLLAIGRFYSATNNNADSEQTGQTALAMQSFLSGTFSQQLNQILNQLIGNNQWSFGANIATGTDGFSNAEYEGTLSGRMFNNRLIVNGQFGYRDNIMTNSQSFIGDFDIQYLLMPNGNISLKVYNQANDRYFTRNSLNTQGIGIVFKKEFGK